MRILHLAAGAAGRYCGACHSDATLARAVAACGQDMEIVPLYTPLQLDEDLVVPAGPVFYGGINVWLQQATSLFRWLPRWLDRFLDAPALLRLLSSFAIRTVPERLGPLTVSVLAGREGRQSKELRRLLAHLQGRPRPDVVSLSNSLLSGLAPDLKEGLQTPVLCMVQGEDVFLEALPEPSRSLARKRLRRQAKHIDLFVAPSQAHAARMIEILAIPPRKMVVIRTGIEADRFPRVASPPTTPLAIGYLGSIQRAKGLDLLLEALLPLAQASPGRFRLLIAGQIVQAGYWRMLQDRLRGTALGAHTHYAGVLNGPAKAAFLQAISLLVAPSRIPEARALASLEAMAAGVPLVAPRIGVFPEWIALTGGGQLFSVEDSASLRARLGELFADPTALAALGRAAAAGVRSQFTTTNMAREFLDQCRRLVVSRVDGAKARS